jgi:hypothetical protein
VFSCNHDSLVAENIDPLQARLELTDVELKKKEIGLRLHAVLRLQPRQSGGGETEKLDPLHARLELTDAELKKNVLRLPAVLHCAKSSGNTRG